MTKYLQPVSLSPQKGSEDMTPLIQPFPTMFQTRKELPMVELEFGSRKFFIT